MRPLQLTGLDTALVAPRWGLLRILTADGLEGFGEFTLEGQSGSAEATVRELWPYFENQDARQLKRLVRGAYDQSFYHGGAHFMSALGGIEIALWDLLGKAARVPVYQLLGGAVRDRVKVYRWAGGNNNEPEAAAEEAARVVAEGARAIKINACPPLAAIDTYGGIRPALHRARAVRKAVGGDVDIAFDLHGRANVPMARRLVRELEEVSPLFYEEPVRPDYNRWLPGIANTQAVAALCEANGLALAPHCPLSPIAFMACLHVTVTSPAGWILEWSKGIHYNASGATGDVDPWLRYLDPADWPMFDLDAVGHLALPAGPGLGIRVNWPEVERAARAGIVWRDERMLLPDGTRANW